MIPKLSTVRLVCATLIISVVINIVWICFVAIRIHAVYCCRESICEHDMVDFVDMNWRLRYYRSPCLILSTHRGLSYDSCFYCVSSRVCLCSKMDEIGDDTIISTRRVLVGAPNYKLSFECDQDGFVRHGMLKYNDTLIDIDAMEVFQ